LPIVGFTDLPLFAAFALRYSVHVPRVKMAVALPVEPFGKTLGMLFSTFPGEIVCKVYGYLKSQTCPFRQNFLHTVENSDKSTVIDLRSGMEFFQLRIGFPTNYLEKVQRFPIESRVYGKVSRLIFLRRFSRGLPV